MASHSTAEIAASRPAAVPPRRGLETAEEVERWLRSAPRPSLAVRRARARRLLAALRDIR